MRRYVTIFIFIEQRFTQLQPCAPLSTSIFDFIFQQIFHPKFRHRTERTMTRDDNVRSLDMRAI